MRRERYGSTGILDAVEVARIGATTNIGYRRWVAPDMVTPVETRAATTNEAQWLRDEEEANEEGRARRGPTVRAALQTVLSSSIGNDLVTVLVAGGVVPIKAAKAAGWSPV